MTGETIILWVLGTCACVCAVAATVIIVGIAISELRAIIRDWKEKP